MTVGPGVRIRLDICGEPIHRLAAFAELIDSALVQHAASSKKRGPHLFGGMACPVPRPHPPLSLDPIDRKHASM